MKARFPDVRVLQVSNFYPPYWIGGYEQIAEWVAGGLRERGHEVAVLTGRGPAFAGRPEIHPDLDLDLASARASYFTTGLVAENGLADGLRHHVFSRRNYGACRRVMALVRPDIVSFWNPAFITLSPLVAARLAGVPAVAHLSDTVANVFRNPHPPRFPERLRPAARRGVDLLLRGSRPRRFVVPSAFLREKFVREEGLPADRVEVLRWPVEPSVSRATPQRRGGEGRRLIFVGTLIPEKGPEVLLAAFREAVARDPALTLTLVGEGPEAYVLGLRRAAEGLPVRFAGRLDRAAVVEAYRGHDVLVFPSVWDEPFAVVPLEAMAMGLAVVATAAGGTPEAIEDGRTGLLVPPRDVDALRDALLRLCGDAALTRSLAEAGQRFARETLGFAAFMDRLERLYESVRAGQERVA